MTQLEARIALILRRRGLADVTVEFVVDTGFASALTLPPNAIAALRLPFVQRTSASLADNQSVRADVHRAVVLWRDQETDVAVLALGERPLLGTALLNGTELTIQFAEGGAVTVTEL